ncbi:MAG: 3-oxoacid CoA-transferase subunit B [Candidatus Sumerlaeia bacterium]|nr:3-oxoacid CoA-transferase subunit B [Candidatus Sumerlaeia bacterium]
MSALSLSPQEEIIIRRAAQELKPGMLVNLGIGLPTLIPSVLPQDSGITLHSENGFVGVGAPVVGTPDYPVIDAGGRAVSLLKGAACFDSSFSFALVRGGKLDAAVLGAFEVSLSGDLANWMIPGKLTPGMGGGMELAQKARKVIVLSRHADKSGTPKLVERCSLPLTAPSCVTLLITEFAVFERLEGKMTLVSVHPSTTKEAVLSGFTFSVPSIPELRSWS